LKALEQKNKSLRSIFVVADNARDYRNRKVKAFLETSKAFAGHHYRLLF
jgi:hypothetical protein